MIEAVLLDVDGTLIDSNDAHARAWVDALAEEGFAVEFATVRALIGMGGDHLIPEVTGLTKESDAGWKLSARRARIFNERYVNDVRPFPKVRELLERFRDDGVKMVVATSADRDDLARLLERAGVADLLPERTTSHDAERSKPDPDIVAGALAKAGVSAHRAVMIGDTPYDLEAAARAGVPAVALTCGGWPPDKLTPALAIYESPAHLLAEYDAGPFRRD